MPYDKMKITQLVRHINRLEWAAETTDDYKWAKQHQSERQYCIDILISKFCYQWWKTMLFDKYDFKKFARAVRKVNSRFMGREIRQLYSGYLYPELPLYLKITEILDA